MPSQIVIGGDDDDDANGSDDDGDVAVVAGSIAAAVVVAAGLLYFFYRRNRRFSREQRYLSKQVPIGGGEKSSVTVFKRESMLEHTIMLQTPVTNPIVLSNRGANNESGHDSDDDLNL